jgi:hypothetical protein
MLDIETTGLDPETNEISSFALVQFSMPNFLLGNCITQRMPWATDRVSDSVTIKWRIKHDVASRETDLLLHRQISTALGDIANLMQSAGDPDQVFIWAWHTQFDLAFLQSYFAAYSKGKKELPWRHYNVMDLPSFIAGRGKNPREIKRAVLAKSDMVAHSAYEDCVLQIEMLSEAVLIPEL